MKHLVGGYCLGILFAMIACKPFDSTTKSWSDLLAGYIALNMWGFVFAGMAWGLLP